MTELIPTELKYQHKSGMQTR